MPDAQQLLMFVLAGVLLNLTPGPDVLYIVNQSLRGGVRPGLVAAWGITAGCFVHVGIAAFGLGVLLSSSVHAFNAVKWLGAAYLVWTGGRLLLNQATAEKCDNSDEGQAESIVLAEPVFESAKKSISCAAKVQVPGSRSVFVGAFMTNALNPKVALFFLAFVPQFIPAHALDPVWSFVLLGGLFTLNNLLVSMGWAVAAAWLIRRAPGLQLVMHHLDRLAGLMFMGFGLQLAMTDVPVH